jgi:hypothetical protein
MVIENVTGWNELMTGNITGAAFQAIDVPLGGYLILGIYIIIIFVLWMRTQSVELCAVMSLLFLGMFIASPWVAVNRGKGILMIMTVFFIAGWIFKAIAKEKNYSGG